MAIVTLRPPLRELAGGQREVVVRGSTVADALRDLERIYPRLFGWVLDEQGRVRRHIGVFVNGERAALAASVDTDDRVHILPAISGGGDADTELLVGTRKGLFVLRGPRGGRSDIMTRAFAGQVVEYAIRDPRTGTYYASVTQGQFGPHLYLADDPTGEWKEADGPAFPEDAGASVERIWVVQPGEDGDFPLEAGRVEPASKRAFA